MTGTVEFIQRIRYAEIPDEKGEMQVYAIPETEENIRELVRCKDCKYGHHVINTVNDEVRIYRVSCTKPYAERGSAMHEPDWFCADGERQEGR